MPTTQTVHGIANGHWERPKPRSAWLLLLARLSVVELRALSELARAALHERSAGRHEELAPVDHASHRSVAAAE